MAKRRSLRNALICAAAMAAASCATSMDGGAGIGGPQWAANGWLSPGPNGEPEIIGLFVTRKACEKAVKEWMSRQVVGNPIYGGRLPIDRR